MSEIKASPSMAPTGGAGNGNHCCRLSVRGLVQGVGFRHALCTEARQAGLTGWVRNRHDGSVEAFLQGPPAAVADVVDWAHRGPPAARVDAVDIALAGADPMLAGFEQWPTA